MEAILRFIKNNAWIEAKTFRDFAPHEYVVKNRLSYEDRAVFVHFVNYIRKNGYEKNFGSKVFIYLDIDGYSYWTMGAPILETTILNRALLANNR